MVQPFHLSHGANLLYHVAPFLSTLLGMPGGAASLIGLSDLCMTGPMIEPADSNCPARGRPERSPGNRNSLIFERWDGTRVLGRVPCGWGAP